MVHGVTPQVLEALKVLIVAKRPMTASMVAHELGIPRQNATRLLRPLVACRVVRSGRMPTGGAFAEGHGKRMYWALSQAAAHIAYIGYARREFSEMFGALYPPMPK